MDVEGLSGGLLAGEQHVRGANVQQMPHQHLLCPLYGRLHRFATTCADIRVICGGEADYAGNVADPESGCGTRSCNE
eukprot:1249080-Rhodomonas_salina.2